MNKNDALISEYLNETIPDAVWLHLLQTQPGLREAWSRFTQVSAHNLERTVEAARAWA